MTPSPGWLAWIVHVPVVTSIAAEPDTVQMLVVVDVRLTGNHELALAVKVTGTEELMICGGMLLKVIVWLSKLTVKLCVTWVAGAYTLLPA